MNKPILALVAGIMAASTIYAGTNAQSTHNVSTFTGSKTFIKSVQTIAALDLSFTFSGTNALDAKSINVKAIKDFKGRFDRAQNEKWFAISGGYMSSFNMDGYVDRAFYDKKGHWLSSLTLYGEHGLPKEIRSLVRGSYLDFTITLVEEVQIPENTVYIVHLEDQKHLKIVRVTTDGDMDVMQEFDKN